MTTIATTAAQWTSEDFWDTATRSDVADHVDKGFDPNARGNYGVRPLHRAAGIGNFEAVKALIAHGADVNAADDDGYTALHLAHGVYVVKELIDHDADVNAPDVNKWTPLHHAVQGADTFRVEALIAAGANINAKNNRGHTPSHYLPTDPFPANPEIEKMLGIGKGAIGQGLA